MCKMKRLRFTGIGKRSLSLCFSLLAFFLLAAPVRSASEWTEYSRDQEGNVYFYKVNKTRGRHIVQVRDQKNFSAEGRKKHLTEMTRNGFATAGYDNLSTLKVLVEINCKKKMSKGLTVNMFDSADRALYSMFYDTSEWTYIPADSLWETLRKQACR